MKLYNTLSKKIDEIKPINVPIVTIYTCGPTVYDYPHIGNWYTFIRYDLLVRSLIVSGLQPKWVMNITDVGHLVSDADDGEDKLEKGAKRENKTAWDVAKFYGDYFISGLDRLNFTKPDYIPKATNHISEQIELIQKLEAKGYTYLIDDGVYYDSAKFVDYPKFAGLDLDEQQAGVRIEKNLQKRNNSDFALWKFSPKNSKRDMEWDSPWGKGFPGWHIECSAMSIKYLGETLDIHSGGIDHIPVHHTNEIAQSEVVTGKPFANSWMHTNHILINDEKISKSLGNGITLEDIEAKGFSLEAFRLHVLESHYRSQSKFSWESLEAAQNRLRAYRSFADLKWQVPEKLNTKPNILDAAKTKILAALQNDLDTPSVLAELSLVESESIKLIRQIDIASFKDFLKFIDAVLGLNLSQSQDLSDDQKQILKAREAARTKQDWPNSDALRKQLEVQGIGLRDMASGSIWFRL
jgi:cysteinyl-tRNA synthetase